MVPSRLGPRSSGASISEHQVVRSPTGRRSESMSSGGLNRSRARWLERVHVVDSVLPTSERQIALKRRDCRCDVGETPSRHSREPPRSTLATRPTSEDTTRARGRRAAGSHAPSTLATASHGSPNGIRTRAATLRGWCPRPLDDGAMRRPRRSVEADDDPTPSPRHCRQPETATAVWFRRANEAAPRLPHSRHPHP